jgi:2-polyprenyl-6-methoxyphenol hydroxylase-like FAD-dependent oxidoreductase
MDVLISGGGIAGLTLAFSLRRYGRRLVIVEKPPSLRDEGYMIDFFGSGYDAAEKMGLLPDFEKIHKLFGSRHFNFMRGDLEPLLYSVIRDWVPVRFSTMVESFEDEGAQVHVTFNDGTASSFDLLVGADGVHSPIRKNGLGRRSML